MRPSRLLMPALRARRSLLARIHRRRLVAARAELERRHGDQRLAWEQRCEGLAKVYAAIRPYQEARFIEPMWAHYQRRLERYLVPRPPFDFLSATTMRETMVLVSGGGRYRRELEICRRAWGAELDSLAEEDLAGDPVLHSRVPLTSHTRIHHLHSLARHRLACGPGLAAAPVVVEWGAGFGGMARLIRRLGPDTPSTLVLVDLPVISTLQWVYLGVTLGPEEVHLVDRPGAGIVPGRVNIVPHGLLDEITLTPDAFISTWGLGESEPAAQNACLERGWLDATHLLIADQRTGHGTNNSDRLLALADSSDALVEPVNTVPGSRYVLR